VIAAAAVAMVGGCTKSSHDASPAVETHISSFATPDEALAALIAVLEKQDNRALQVLLGPGTADLVSSGDAVADRRARDSFLERYRTRHELVGGSSDDLVLLVGDDRWPLPIPLVRTEDGRWTFDGAAGARELVLRRIGANELHTIDVMYGYVAAQRDYASMGHDGAPPGIYAKTLRSDPGKHDGLYWEVSAGEPPSPAGPLLAAATSEGYMVKHGSHSPYHGYLFRTLSSQGPAAEGGAQDYLSDGKLSRGFALIAYPETYGVSGVMTFIVNQDGVVWQRDLGKHTTAEVMAIQQFNPDESWTPLAPED
jgi:hypothetical protein